MTKKKGILIGAAAAVVALGVGGFFVMKENNKKVLYNDGAMAYQAGDFALARERFEQIPGYENVDELLREVDYQLAVQDFDNGNDEAAEKTFSEMPDYKDSQKYLYEITYHKMKACMEAGDYETADSYADSIMGYSDVADVKQEILYHRAVSRIDQVDFDGAKELIAQISSEEKAAELLNMIQNTQYAVPCFKDLLGRYADIHAQSVTVLEARYCVLSYNYGAQMPLIMFHIQVIDENGNEGEAYSAYNNQTYFASCLSLDLSTLDMKNQAEMAAFLKIQPNWEAPDTTMLSAPALNILATQS